MITADIPQLALDRPLDSGVSRWTPYHETQLLVWLAGRTRGTIVEIGCNNGLTTRELALAYPDRTVVALDFLGDEDTMVPEQRYEKPWLEFGLHCRDLPNVVLLNQDSKTFDYARYEPVGFVFIDGDHSYQGVKADTERVFAQTRNSPVVAWHDYSETHPEWVGVKQYIDTEVDPVYNLVRWNNTWVVSTPWVMLP